MWRRSVKVVAAALLIIVGVLGQQNPAWADGWEAATPTALSGSSKTCLTSTYAKGCFQPSGEWVWIQDQYENRKPVAVVWFYYPPGSSTWTREGTIYAHQGVAAGWHARNKSFDEGGIFKFNVCQAVLNDSVSDCLPNSARVGT